MRRLFVLSTLLCLSSAAALRFVLLSDFNGSYGSVTYPAAVERTVQRTINEWKPDLVLSAGDLIAGQKAALTDAKVRAMWGGFERDVRLPLERAGIPFAFTLGNHDAGLNRDRREAAAYWKNHLPDLNYVDKSNFPFRYSFRVGGVFIAVLDAAGPHVGTDQRNWLSAQLASPLAQGAQFRLVMGHLPLAGISREKNKAGEIIREAAALQAVLEQGRVTAYIHGHHAAYFPGRLGQLGILSSGGIGGRDYVGFVGTARSVVTVLDVQQDTIKLTAYDADTGEIIPTESLPARLNGLGGPVFRVSGFAQSAPLK